MNFWFNNGEVSWKNEDFGIFDENGDFVNSKFRPPLSFSFVGYLQKEWLGYQECKNQVKWWVRKGSLEFCKKKEFLGLFWMIFGDE